MRFKLLVVLICANTILFGVTINNITGKVEVKKNDSTTWIKASEGMEIDLSDTVSTGFASTAVVNLGKATVALEPLTRLTVDMLVDSGSKVTTSLFLQVGAVKADVETSENVKQNFQIQSPFSTASVRGTSFRFSGLKLEVYSGKVALKLGPPKRLKQKEGSTAQDAEEPTEQEEVIVNPGQKVEIIPGTTDVITDDDRVINQSEPEDTTEPEIDRGAPPESSNLTIIWSQE
ncbi:MAG: FecR domain-containing protein [Spirochaetales bacterium]|nr:FecR domain-containing protein [Spirochaetales bacterium]